jgi:hypothetical protein
MKTAVSALVSTPTQAEEAIDHLRQSGFGPTDISFLYSDEKGSNKLFHVNSTKAPEGTVAGGSTAGLVGGIAGFLVGMGALTIPGLGAFVAAGPILSALSGAAVGAAVGGLAGCLVGLGLPEYEAKFYAGKVNEGSMLIVVHCDDDQDKQGIARAAFELVKAHDISTTTPVSAPS